METTTPASQFSTHIPNIRVKKTTLDISGFGGGYEDACQRMLWKGVAYLDEMQPPLSIWDGAKQYENIIGVMSVDGEELQALEAAATAGEDDITGAMHQAVMNLLSFIHHNGVDATMDKVLEREPDRLYVWEGELFPSEATDERE